MCTVRRWFYFYAALVVLFATATAVAIASIAIAALLCLHSPKTHHAFQVMCLSLAGAVCAVACVASISAAERMLALHRELEMKG